MPRAGGRRARRRRSPRAPSGRARPGAPRAEPRAPAPSRGGRAPRLRAARPRRRRSPERPERERNRVVARAGLLDVLESEARVEEGLQEEPEREVRGTDPRAEPTRGDPGRVLVAAGVPVSRVESRHALACHELRVRADEARMDAEMNESSAGTEDAGGLAQGRLEVV